MQRKEYFEFSLFNVFGIGENKSKINSEEFNKLNANEDLEQVLKTD